MKQTKTSKEYGHKVRILKLQRLLLEQPFRYTKRQLAERIGIKPDAMKDYFDNLKTAGYEVKFDEQYRYGFSADKTYEELKDFLHFSKKEQEFLLDVINRLGHHDPSLEKLKRKIVSIYDFSRLGNPTLRKPHLSKIDLLEQAKREKRQVILLEYHSSNSNDISDRRVEPFDPNPANDMLQAFDINKKDIRHFRISRVTRIQLTNDPWAHETLHRVEATDPFYIVDDNQVPVHLRLTVGAKNELVERFPLSQVYIQPAEEPGIYDFQCKVNCQFKGLTNFILGFYHRIVEVLHPDALIEHLNKEVQNMKF
jgi:predicted DNA-binding transcriptional regulator YafY